MFMVYSGDDVMKYLLCYVLGVVIMLFYFKNRAPTKVKTMSHLIFVLISRWVLIPIIIGLSILFIAGKL